MINPLLNEADFFLTFQLNADEKVEKLKKVLDKALNL